MKNIYYVEINNLLKKNECHILNFYEDENIFIKLNKNLSANSTYHIALSCSSISKLYFKSSYSGYLLPNYAENYINEFINCCNLISKNEFDAIVKKIQMLL